MRQRHRSASAGPAPYRFAKRSGAGFTVIELMIVSAIIGIFLVVLIPAIKRRYDRGNDPARRASAVQLAERQGLRNAEVVAAWRTRRMSYQDQVTLGCLGEDESVYQVEGVGQKEQRTRMVVCCRTTTSGAACAIPSPARLVPENR